MSAQRFLGALLLALLAHNAPGVEVSAEARAEAAALVRRVRADPAALPALRRALADGPPAEAIHLLHVLTAERIVAARPALTVALGAEDPAVARAAIDAVDLLGIEDGEQLAAVRRLLADPVLRLRALVVLIGLGDDRSIPEIIALLDDPAPLVREQAARSLRALTGHDAGERADAWRAWYRAEEARARREIGLIQPAVDAGPDPAAALELARRLAALPVHGHLAAEELALLLESPDPAVVAVARTALRDLDVPEAALALRAAETAPPSAAPVRPAAAPPSEGEEPEGSRWPVALGIPGGLLLLWILVPRRRDRSSGSGPDGPDRPRVVVSR